MNRPLSTASKVDVLPIAMDDAPHLLLGDSEFLRQCGEWLALFMLLGGLGISLSFRQVTEPDDARFLKRFISLVQEFHLRQFGGK